MANAEQPAHPHPPMSAALVLGALGVVYGDIGTSPLYALRECFRGSHAVEVTHGNVLGVLSLIFWSLILVVSIKYLVFVLGADDRGEGGILALLNLALPGSERGSVSRPILFALGIFGAALLYSDGMITPSISVLSAIEGLEVATPDFAPFVVPVTLVVLVGLFAVQRAGTGRVGIVFGPIMLVWFVCIAALGIRGILGAPEVLQAFNPWHGLTFLVAQGWTGLFVLGAVFLVVTGAEALYADLGHFGLRPIRANWFALVLPALMLNYLGQGALLLRDPAARTNPFYLLAPSWMLYPLVVLAAAATVIASQALISGVFSLTMQALQLGYLPRMRITHTSSSARGQIYMPQVNWILMLACVGLVLGFESSDRLAAAYGIAVTLTMIITSILYAAAARRLFGWGTARAGLICGGFLIVDLVFLSANILKISHGGWLPLSVAGGLFAVMSTWRKGRSLLRSRLESSMIGLDDFLMSIALENPVRVRGTAIFLAGNPAGIPLALLHNFKHNKVIHERVIFLTISIQLAARVPAEGRVKVTELGSGFYRVTGEYGFMDEPRILDLLRACAGKGLEINADQATFFLSRETIVSSVKPGFARWRAWLFSFLSRNAQPATEFFGLPPNRVAELGMHVDI